MPPPSSSQKKNNGANANALQMLMQGKGRKMVPSKRGGSAMKHKSTSVGFVACPAGCGCHIPNLDHKINQHLDRHCSVMNPPKKKHKPGPISTPKSQAINTDNVAEPMECGNHETPAPENLPGKDTLQPVSTPCHSTSIRDKEENSGTNSAAATTPAATSATPMDCETTTETTDEICTPANMRTDHQETSLQASAQTTEELYTPPEKELPTADNLKAKKDITVSNTDTPANGKSTGSNNALVSPSPQSQPTPAARKPNNNPYHGTNSKRNLKGAPKQPTKPANNVFSHMMQQSSKVFAKKSSEIPQYFCLNYDASNQSFSWDLHTTQPWDSSPLWECAVQVKDKPNQTVIDLHLFATCTNVTTPKSLNNNHRWVQFPSRLSVPVLKSILQKSVRRRRPMPSVRVAMELMDKALGELVRRLPIIILEDSSLHPDFALVVWAMVAHSKGFFFDDSDKPASPAHAAMMHALKLRLLRIVYQVAACPIQDHLKEEEVQLDDDDNNNKPSLSDPFPIRREANRSKDEPSKATAQQKEMQLTIWAMLVRAQYGGMACDVRMLQGFAQLWQIRMDHGKVTLPPDLKLQDWSQVPAHLHATGIAQSLARIPANSALDRLSLTDICKEGVDFHCSNLVPSLLEDKEIMGRSGGMAKELQLSSKELLLKQCIWKFSAGVNLRRPLLAEPKTSLSQTSMEEEEQLKRFWKDNLLPQVTAYQTKYVRDRLRL